MHRPTACRLSVLALLACLLTVLGPRAAEAIPLLNGLGGAAGYGTGVLPANDDQSTGAIDLTTAFPHGLNFFRAGMAFYTSVFVNNNGNVTFGAALGGYTPVAFPVASQPMIAPFWGDVYTLGTVPASPSNLVYYDVRPGQFTATWYMVGYYAMHTDLLNDFQLILTDASASGVAGDFDVEFRYNRCQWTTGDASGGTGGLGGTPAQAGFDAGDRVHFTTLPGSRTAAVLALCTTSNVVPPVPGLWRFQIRSGGVADCGNCVLEGGEQCDFCRTTPVATCSHTCRTRLPNGSACGTNGDLCLSGNCVDGVCCNTACNGQCQACDGPAPGICTPVAGAPHGARAACGGTAPCAGACDGSNPTACAFPGGGTTCAAGTCSAGTQTNPRACSGTGVCGAPVTSPCGAYVCGATACLTTCGSDADCVPGNYCNASARCVPRQTPGTTCTLDRQCLSSHCVDGVCCDTACNGQCQACDVSGSGGTCTTVTGPPHGARTACLGVPGTTCAGACNGSNPAGCTYPTVSTTCRAASCAAGTATAASTCDGNGACPSPSVSLCAPFVCGPTACLTMCATTADCTPGSFCMGGTCTGQRPPGGACTVTEQCLSGHCVDGVCCDTACDGQCEACDVTAGVCTPVTGSPHGGRAQCTGADGDVCQGTCGGTDRRACTYPGASTMCRMASCTTGVSTAAAGCDGGGHCAAAMTAPCTPYACGPTACLTMCATTADCAMGDYCMGGMCVPQLPGGGTCTTNDQCGTGHCVDGMCCDTACTGQCEACNVPDHVGVCTPVTGAPHGMRAACAGTPGDACAGACGGTDRAACTYPDMTTMCRAASCMTGTATTAATCDGHGACPAPSRSPCAPYVCGPTACLAACTSSTDCVADSYCVGGMCTGRRPPGGMCHMDEECGSNHCVDGICCDTTCTGQCEACDAPGNVGTCSAVTGAPHGTRSACTGTGACAGTCNGTARAVCTFPPATTQCRAPTCASGTATASATCDGTGNCPAAVTTMCGTYGCGDTACRTSCTANGDCAAGDNCVDGMCVMPRGPGSPCTSNAQCGSATCAQGVCCNQACDGVCQACDLPGAVGTCSPRPAGAPPGVGADGGTALADASVPTGCQMCDGRGACATPPTPDAGMTDIGTPVLSYQGGGCGCTVPAPRAGNEAARGAAAMLVAGLAALLARRRRGAR